MWSRSFERFGGIAAMAAGVASFAYALAFLVVRTPVGASLALLLTGLFGTAAIVAVYGRIRLVDGGFALWALVLGIIASLGAIIHGGYDLANAVTRVITPNLPNAFNPRGLVTFGIAGLGTLVVSWLILRGGGFPRRLGYLGLVVSVLLVVLYLGRLLIVNAANPLISVPALVTGLVASPLWYGWIGLELWRSPNARTAPTSGAAVPGGAK
jgi:hypothetical protein